MRGLRVLEVLRVLKVLTVLVLSGGVMPASAQEVGPTRGSLVIVGGGGRIADIGILRRFIDPAGGPEAPIVVIPTAGEEEAYDRFWPGLRQLRDAGARTLAVLHTRDRAVADSEAFAKPIREAGGVWMPGGRHWRLADSYLNTQPQHG